MFSKCSLIPRHTISRNIDEEKFWNECYKNIKIFNFQNDIFFKMLQKQIKYNLRHTVNFNNFKISKKKFNDFN